MFTAPQVDSFHLYFFIQSDAISLLRHESAEFSSGLPKLLSEVRKLWVNLKLSAVNVKNA